jgi:hypothetical protein
MIGLRQGVLSSHQSERDRAGAALPTWSVPPWSSPSLYAAVVSGIGMLAVRSHSAAYRGSKKSHDLLTCRDSAVALPHR